MLKNTYNSRTLTRCHPALLALAKDAGGFYPLAGRMGLCWVRMYKWIRGVDIPRTFDAYPLAQAYAEKHAGKPLERLFHRRRLRSQHRPESVRQPRRVEPHDAIDFALDLPKLMEKLNRRQKIIICERLQGATLADIAELCGVTGEAIRQQEEKAIEIMRRRCLALGVR
jgi:hypothetical protein